MSTDVFIPQRMHIRFDGYAKQIGTRDCWELDAFSPFVIAGRLLSRPLNPITFARSTMRRDWERHRQRDRMRTHGAESARGEAHLVLPPVPARAPQPRVSKADCVPRPMSRSLIGRRGSIRRYAPKTWGATQK